MHIPNGFLKPFYKEQLSCLNAEEKFDQIFHSLSFFSLHCFHLLFFVIKLYKITLITSYNRKTPSDQKVYKGARISYSKCLQSKIVYVMFSCKNSLIRGKSHTPHLSGKKKTSKENGTQGSGFSPKRNVLLSKN